MGKCGSLNYTYISGRVQETYDYIFLRVLNILKELMEMFNFISLGFLMLKSVRMAVEL